MTQNQRIALNAIATYGRTLVSMLCGVFTGRWALMALGQVDYGLYGVIAGLTGIIVVVNGLLCSSTARFYAIEVGKAMGEGGTSALEDCRRWFSIACLLHFSLPVFSFVVGYPLGIW